MRCLLVANPTAQTGRAEARIKKVQETLHKEGVDSEFIATAPEGKTVSMVREAINQEAKKNGGLDAVICMGGDGTFNEVAKGILSADPTDTKIPMGFLPSGTANDQGKSLGLASDEGALLQNIAIIRAGHLTHLDVGEIVRLDPDSPKQAGEASHTDLFFDSVGFGLQAEILHRRNQDRDAVQKVPLLREIYRDQAVYAGAAFKEYLASFVEPMKFAARIVTEDGQAHEFDELTDVIVKNTAIYGGAWVLDRHSLPDDGRMECAPILSRRDLFYRAIADLKDLPIWEEHLDALGVGSFRPFAGRSFDLRLSRPQKAELASQIDGDEWERGAHFEIRVLHGALPVFTPAQWKAPWKGKAG
jgi:diacylglycerol kinase family enzyme